ncbi:MAG TPA: amino acid racemase [Spirochaetota bacterium]|nr:amino acid racemase [Spirochaetota bacterium]HPI88933.1 amino acid racemase [Spirochaetota bacterium]HPR46590.1 amino acid racemase [Spirochaetota bacterium]
MKTLGIIGGIGPQSTLDYYREIISGYRKISGSPDYPHIIINSIDMTGMLDLVARSDYPNLVRLLVSEIEKLKRAGAEFALIASNTPHIVFDDVKRSSPLPLISIVEATAEKAQSLKLKRLLLLGTGFTMKSRFYADCLSRYGISVSVPPEQEQKFIHEVIFDDLEEGIVIPEKKARVVALCAAIIEKESIDGIILGCTELPLMIRDGDFNVAVLNTAGIHIEAAVRVLLEQSSVSGA